MAKLGQFLYSKLIVILCITTFIFLRTLSTCDAQPTNPCISALNLEEGGNAQEGITVFIKPGARVAQGTDLSFLCCLYTMQTGLTIPGWTFEPASNGETFNVDPVLSVPLYNGKSLLYRTMKVTATEIINNTMVRCGSPQFQDVWNTIIVMGEYNNPCSDNAWILFVVHIPRSAPTSQSHVGDPRHLYHKMGSSVFLVRVPSHWIQSNSTSIQWTATA